MEIIDGFLNINKPAGWTSHDVVAKARNLLKIKKVGHIGTLDPMATGVLPICFGRGTKIAQYLVGEEKGYQAVMRLGEATDTQDASGKIIRKTEVRDLDTKSVYDVVSEFVGTIKQIPPMYSAIKVGGFPLYKRARAGEVVDRKPREVKIEDIKILAIEGRDGTLDIRCSKGTYIRTICYDIGERLGVGAHLLKLQRRRNGIFTINDAITIGELEDLIKAGNLCRAVYSLDKILSSFPILVVNEITVRRLANGLPSIVGDLNEVPVLGPSEKEERYRVHDKDGRLIAIASLCASSLEDGGKYSKKRLKIEKVLIAH